MRMLDLNSLLGTKYEEATFHDSELESFAFDFMDSSARFELRIPCGITSDQSLSYQRGRLEFKDLYFYFVEPATYRAEMNESPTLWITSDGPLPDPKIDVSERVPKDLPEEVFVHYLYSSTTNSFIVVGAKQANFEWKEKRQNA